MSSTEKPLLVYANPEFVSDLYYLSGLMTPDPYVLIKNGDHTTVAVSPLEYGRAVKEARAQKVVDIQTLSERNEPLLGKGLSPEAATILTLLSDQGISSVEVTRDFPFYLADELKSQGIELSAYPKAMLDERVIKTNEEVELIRDAIGTTEQCLARVEQILGESIVEDGMLKWEGDWLTSEEVHRQIELVCLSKDAVAGHPIVAGGDQGCDPHERGHGILYANQLIIVDIFPRSKTHLYWGDLTRTFFKGKPSSEQMKLVETVAEAQKVAIDKVAAGVITGSIHAAVEELFEKKGYRTEQKNGTYQGFFHGTGHGFGLDIHEPPRLGKKQEVTLKPGMVVTVEPGLYYPGLGGCRIEDDVLVTENGCEMLSHYSYDWIIS